MSRYAMVLVEIEDPVSYEQRQTIRYIERYSKYRFTGNTYDHARNFINKCRASADKRYSEIKRMETAKRNNARTCDCCHCSTCWGRGY